MNEPNRGKNKTQQAKEEKECLCAPLYSTLDINSFPSVYCSLSLAFCSINTNRISFSFFCLSAYLKHSTHLTFATETLVHPKLKTNDRKKNLSLSYTKRNKTTLSGFVFAKLCIFPLISQSSADENHCTVFDTLQTTVTPKYLLYRIGIPFFFSRSNCVSGIGNLWIQQKSIGL